MDIQKKIADHIAKFGHSIMGVFEGEDSPSFACTIGLTHKLQHKELLMVGIPYDYTAQILNAIVLKIKTDGPIKDGDVLEKIANFPLIAREMTDDIAGEYAIQCNLYYSDRDLGKPSFMIIYWPDKQGIFPWQENFDRKLLGIQPKYATLN